VQECPPVSDIFPETVRPLFAGFGIVGTYPLPHTNKLSPVEADPSLLSNTLLYMI